MFSNATALASAANSQSTSHYLPPNTPPTVRAGYEAQFAFLAKDLLSSSIAYLEFIFDDTTILPALHQPFSRGTVLINSTSPFDNPVIDPRYLNNPLDLALFVAGFNYTRTIRKTDAMQDINTTETYPGVSVLTKEEIEEFVKGGIDTEHHHAGTASMLPLELGGVVDPELRVYGVEGLRIVDASVVPMLPAAHLQATLYGLSEKVSMNIVYCQFLSVDFKLGSGFDQEQLYGSDSNREFHGLMNHLVRSKVGTSQRDFYIAFM